MKALVVFAVAVACIVLPGCDGDSDDGNGGAGFTDILGQLVGDLVDGDDDVNGEPNVGLPQADFGATHCCVPGVGSCPLFNPGGPYDWSCTCTDSFNIYYGVTC